MKPGATLINASRGPIVEWRALLAALDAGRPGSAALDVYDEEPLPSDHPLRSHPRVLLTPHLGYATRETFEILYGQTLESVSAFLAGNPVRTL